MLINVIVLHIYCYLFIVIKEINIERKVNKNNAIYQQHYTHNLNLIVQAIDLNTSL